MDKNKTHGNELKKNMDLLTSRISALEASTTDREKKSLMEVLLILVENQKKIIDEFDHLKKALDLLTAYLFKMDQGKK